MPKQDKGVAGLNIFLSLIVIIFIIGLLVMIFVIMGSKMSDSVYDVKTGTTNLEAGSIADATYTLASSDAGIRGYRGSSIVAIINTTDNANKLIKSGNYTLTGSVLSNATAIEFPDVAINYTYTYDSENTATNVINDTSTAIATTSDWFGIFIVIGAMVVLILLTVIIITAIRSSGLVGGAPAPNKNVGTA